MDTVPEINIELSCDATTYKSPKGLYAGLSVIADQT